MKQQSNHTKNPKVKKVGICVNSISDWKRDLWFIFVIIWLCLNDMNQLCFLKKVIRLLSTFVNGEIKKIL